MARNKQKADKRHMICENCQMGFCEGCIDISLTVVGRKGFCQCTRKGHSGEPRDNQITDPVTGTVYAPGLKVDIDGKVMRNGRD